MENTSRNHELKVSRHCNKEQQSMKNNWQTGEFNGTDVTIKKIKVKLQKLQADMIQRLDEQFKEIVGDMVENMENTEISQVNHEVLYDNVKYNNRTKSSKDGKLSEKKFLARESLLTDLFAIKHFYTIYNIFVAILIILFLNTAVYDIVVSGQLNLGFSLIQWNFGGFHIAVVLWIAMMSGTMGIYCCFHYWAHHRRHYVEKSISRKAWDYGWLSLFIIYQGFFGVWPVKQLLKYDLPPASSMALLMEQVRLIMKTHAFVRSNAASVLSYKPHSEQDEKKLCPDFGNFLYFLFVPTLVYRNSYPRTHKIRWRKVIWHFMEVVGVIFYVSFIFERFLMPMFDQYGVKHFAPEHLVVSIFGSMMPATLAFLCAFFGLLHSWMNAFAEITRFADRMFYKDWWNANSYAEYFRMWNLVVHDWLYTYIFKDYCLLMKSKGRLGPTMTVFIVSALVHEYILMFVFRFFYPMLFVAFGGFSAIFVFLTGNSAKGGNLFMWLTLCTGTGVLTSMYSLEWYSRINCPQVMDNVWDFFIPRSWFCNAVELGI